MLLALPNFYFTLYTILNSSTTTSGSLLSTKTVINHVLTEEKNAKLGSSQVVFVAHTRSKEKPQLSKASDRDKRNIKCNYCKKKSHIKPECQKLKADQAAKERKSGEKKDFGNKDLVAKVVVAKHNKETIQLFKTRMLTGQKDMLSKWIVDSGASTHMSSQQKWFITYEKLLEPHWVWLGDKHFILAIRTGRICFTATVNGHSTKYILPDIYYVPDLSGNLLSVSTLSQHGYNLEFCKLKCQLIKLGQVVANAHEENNLYILDASLFTPKCTYITIMDNVDTLINSMDISSHHALVISTNSSTGSITTWHCQLGHIMLQSVKKLFQQNMVKGMYITDSTGHDLVTYKACLEDKQTRAPIPKMSDVQNPLVLYRVYSDLVGPIEPHGRGWEYYFMTFLDDCSHYLKVVLLKSKDEAKGQLKSLIEHAEVETGCCVNFFRSGGGGSYSLDSLKKYFTLHGIHHEVTNPDTSQENGLAEHVNCTILDMACTMIKELELPESLWSHAVIYTAYILNRVPTQAIDRDITPYQAYTGNKPSIVHLQVFGCTAYALIPKNKRSKFGSKSLQYTYLGYFSRRKTYILLHHPSSQFFESQDVYFDEGSKVEHTRVVIDLSPNDPSLYECCCVCISGLLS